MAVSAAEYYEVRWRVKGADEAWSDPRRVAPTAEIVIEELDRSQQYEFEVRAVSNCGAKSIWVPSDYTVPGAVPPASVDTLTAQSLADGVHLGWTSIATPAAGIEYSVERSANGTSGWAERTRLRATAYTDPETSGTTYYYRVRAANFAGQYGGYSPVVSNKGIAVGDIAANATNAAADAAAAKLQAQQANAELANIASDNMLSAGEKTTVIRDYNVILAEQAGIDAQASAYGITTSKTAYDNAVATLTSYLAGLTTPTAWDDVTGDTGIVGTTFRSRFATVYTTRQTLLNAIYAAAKAKADAAQTAADAAADKAAKVAKGPGVINPRFADGLDGWTFDDSAGFSAGDNANTPWYLVTTHLARAGQSGTPNTNARNTGYIGVVPGQMVTAIVCLRSISANAGALAFASIAWRDFSGALLSASDSPLTCGPNGTAQNLNSRIAAQAPANAAMAQLIIRYSNHTSGTITASVCSMVAQPASADEVPESGTRKWAGESGATVGANWYTNVSDKPESADNLVSRSTFDDGNASPWSGGTVALSGHPTAARGYRLGGTEIGPERFTVTPGQVLYCAVDHQDAFLPAACSFAMALRFLNSSGSTIQYIRAFTDTSSANNVWHLDRAGLVTVPAGSVKAQVVFYLDNPVTPGTDRVYLTGIRVFKALDSIPDGMGYAKIVSDQLINGVHKLGIAGSGARLGDLRNQVMVGVGNYASGWNGGSITYSATTTSATVSVAASTLVIGSQSLSYSASSVTFSGSAGSTVTRYLYYDDPGYAGGSRSLQATASQITALASDGRVYVGSVKVTFPTSGTGSGTGGGNCPQVDETVIRRGAAGEPERIRAGDVAVGDRLLLASGRWGRVTYSARAVQPGVRVTGRDGSTIMCSASAPLETADGHCVPAARVSGLVLRHRAAGATPVVSVTAVGCIDVQHITCEDACFWVGDYSHHNLKPPPTP